MRGKVNIRRITKSPGRRQYDLNKNRGSEVRTRKSIKNNENFLCAGCCAVCFSNVILFNSNTPPDGRYSRGKGKRNRGLTATKWKARGEGCVAALRNINLVYVRSRRDSIRGKSTSLDLSKLIEGISRLSWRKGSACGACGRLQFGRQVRLIGLETGI